MFPVVQGFLNSCHYNCYICGNVLHYSSISSHINELHGQSEILLQKFYLADDIRATVRLSSLLEELKYREGYISISSLLSYFKKRNKLVVIDMQIPIENEAILKNVITNKVTMQEKSGSLLDNCITEKNFIQSNIENKITHIIKIEPKSEFEEEIRNIELDQKLVEGDFLKAGQQTLSTSEDVGLHYVKTEDIISIKNENLWYEPIEEFQLFKDNQNQGGLNATENLPTENSKEEFCVKDLQKLPKTNNSNQSYLETPSNVGGKENVLINTNNEQVLSITSCSSKTVFVATEESNEPTQNSKKDFQKLPPKKDSNPGYLETANTKCDKENVAINNNDQALSIPCCSNQTVFILSEDIHRPTQNPGNDLRKLSPKNDSNRGYLERASAVCNEEDVVINNNKDQALSIPCVSNQVISSATEDIHGTTQNSEKDLRKLSSKKGSKRSYLETASTVCDKEKVAINNYNDQALSIPCCPNQTNFSVTEDIHGPTQSSEKGLVEHPTYLDCHYDIESDKSSMTDSHRDFSENVFSSSTEEEDEELYVKMLISVNSSEKKVSEKLVSCYFCEMISLHVKIHLLEVHADRNEVKIINKLPMHSKERKMALIKLKNLGNFNHNIKVYQEGNDTIFVAKNSKISDKALFLPCKYCYGFYCRYELNGHASYCIFNNHQVTNILTDGILILLHSISSFPLKPVLTIFENLKNDIINKTLRNDPLILLYGTLLLVKHNEEGPLVIVQKLRQLGKLLLLLNEGLTERKMLTHFLRASYFDHVVKCVQDMNIHKYYKKWADFGLNIGHSLTTCCYMRIGFAIRCKKNNHRREVEDFMKLFNNEWHYRIDSATQRGLSDSKLDVNKVLPLTKDIIRFSSFLIKSVEVKHQNLVNNVCLFNWLELAEVLLCRFVTINKHSGEEVSRFLCRSYQNLPELNTQDYNPFLLFSSYERKLSQIFNVFNITGNNGKHICLVSTAESKRALDTLMATRSAVDIPGESTYVFSNGTPNGYLKCWTVINKLGRECKLNRIDLITSPNLRKQIATTSQILSFPGTEMKWLNNYLSNNVVSSNKHNDISDFALELAKMTKLLMVSEQDKNRVPLAQPLHKKFGNITSNSLAQPSHKKNDNVFSNSNGNATSNFLAVKPILSEQLPLKSCSKRIFQIEETVVANMNIDKPKSKRKKTSSN